MTTGFSKNRVMYIFFWSEQKILFVINFLLLTYIRSKDSTDFKQSPSQDSRVNNFNFTRFYKTLIPYVWKMKFCLYFWIVLAFGSVCLTSPIYQYNCSTDSGPNPNATCIFPFKFNDVRYYQCTTAGNNEGDITPWCSTLVDASGIHIGKVK